MLLPVCEGWAARSNLSIKVLLMPLSFASMLGGMCTLLGTSTNLVLNAQIEQDPHPPCAPSLHHGRPLSARARCISLATSHQPQVPTTQPAGA